MSRLEELIETLCPNGVEYKKLRDVATISRGGSFQKKDYVEDGFPCIHYGQIYTLYGLFVSETANYISEEVAGKQKKAVTNDVIMAVTSENMEDVCKCVAWLGNGDVAVSGHTAIIHHTLDPKYLVYWLHSSMFYSQKVKLAHGTKVIEVKPDSLGTVMLPVPPIEVQHEIVRILDDFTELTEKLITELTTELSARKKQYDYYAKQLFLGTNAENVELSEIASFVYGYTDKAKDTGDARFIRITEINDQGCLKEEEKNYITLNADAMKSLLKKGDLIMARTGATYGKTLFFDSDYPSVFASFLIKIIPSDRLLNRYYWHFTKTSLYWDQASKLVTTGGQPQFNTPAVKRIRIPLPPIEVQRYVAETLDQLDNLNNGLSIGISTEIESRQKQYGYYRDKLLSFKEI